MPTENATVRNIIDDTNFAKDFSRLREIAISRWNLDTLTRLHNFFEYAVDGRRYFEVDKTDESEKVGDELENAYGLDFEEDPKTGALFLTYENKNGKKTKQRGINFLNRHSKGMLEFVDKINQLSEEEIKVIIERLTPNNYASFSERRNMQNVNPDLRRVLSPILSDEQLYEKVFKKELKNHSRISKNALINTAEDIRDKFTRKSTSLSNLRNSGDDVKKDYSYDRIIISHNPRDIALMSTDRNWHSCMGVDGINSHYVPLDIEHGTIIAYATKENDPYIENPIGRALLKPYIDKNGRVFFKAHKTYGNVYQGFLSEVNKIANSDLNQLSDENYFLGNLDPYLYTDGAPETCFELSEDFSREDIPELEDFLHDTFDDEEIVDFLMGEEDLISSSLSLDEDMSAAEVFFKLLPYTDLEIDAEDIWLNNLNIDYRGARTLADNLKGTSAQHIDLDINRLGDRGAKAMAKLLTEDKSKIKSLLIGLNDIQPAGIIAIAKALPQSQLTELSIGGNMFDEESIRELGKQLPQSNLKSLSLKYLHTIEEGHQTFIDEGSFQALCDGIADSQIEELDLSDSNLTLEHIKSLRDLVKKSHNITNIDFEFPTEYAPTLEADIEEVQELWEEIEATLKENRGAKKTNSMPPLACRNVSDNFLYNL